MTAVTDQQEAIRQVTKVRRAEMEHEGGVRWNVRGELMLAAESDLELAAVTKDHRWLHLGTHAEVKVWVWVDPVYGTNFGKMR